MFKFDSVMAFIRNNFMIIAIGLAVVVLLLFASENFSGIEKSDKNSSSSLEVKLETFLSSLQGVGRCDVIIHTDKEKLSSFSSTSDETIKGIAVICDGGGNVSVKNAVTEILTRLFGISGSRISVNEIGK